MIVIRIFKDNAGKFANLTSAVTFESCKRRLRLYFSDLEEVRERIIAGEVIDIPYVTFQRDRRVNEEKRIKNERRRHLKSSRIITPSILRGQKEGVKEKDRERQDDTEYCCKKVVKKIEKESFKESLAEW